MGYPAKSEKKYTYADYLKTPESAKFQLIEGKLIMVPSPSVVHQRVSGALFAVLRQFVLENGLGEVFIAPTDVYLDEHNVVQPDLLFVRKERENVVTKQNIKGAPDLVVEVVSSSSTYRDVVQKKKLYAKFKVSEYWIVHPEEKIVEVYELKENSFKLFKVFKGEDKLGSVILPTLKIHLSEVFN